MVKLAHVDPYIIIIVIQECGRLLVLLCLNSSVQWNSLLQALTTALHWTLTTLYQPGLWASSDATTIAENIIGSHYKILAQSFTAKLPIDH